MANHWLGMGGPVADSAIWSMERNAAIPRPRIGSRSQPAVSRADVFPGTRVPVQTRLEYLEAGDSIDEFLAGFILLDECVDSRLAASLAEVTGNRIVIGRNEICDGYLQLVAARHSRPAQCAEPTCVTRDAREYRPRQPAVRRAIPHFRWANRWGWR
jgi:hypothetical protein